MEHQHREQVMMKRQIIDANNTNITDPLTSDAGVVIIDHSEPIADFFHHTTVLFADIVGFTAWRAGRHPVQVFKLLETLYGAFDRIAKKIGVFKVEAVGDCYVAVTGLPEPRGDHAVAMATFAVECLSVMNQLTASLAPVLGPETTSLSLRIGMHSGPVIGGVLRGEKSRFQLFGDTINTASRMESTGQAERIQLSQETANLLREYGNHDWITPRSDMVLAKGKGSLQTYWMVNNVGTHSVIDRAEKHELQRSPPTAA